MHPDESALTNGKSSVTHQRASDLDELRADRDRGRRSRRSPPAGNQRVDYRDAIEVRLALDAQAPRAARGVVADCLGPRVTQTMLDDAQLLMTELVTNSLRHSGASARDGVVVRVDVTPNLVRLEVEDLGRGGVIGQHAADAERGGGFGLNLVQALSERWGLERVAAGGTRVWAQLARAPDHGDSWS